MANRLLDKRCLLIGGTGGIGRATARRFLQEGAHVAVTGLSPNECAPVRAALEDVGLVHALACDATDNGQVETAFAQAVERLGGLDVLFHVAGRSGRRDGDGSLHACTDAGWHATLHANLTSTFLTNRAAVRHFLTLRQPGVILNMASVLAWSPAPRHFDTIAYTAAKGGILALSRQAASRYAAEQIRINVLAPGLIDTPMAARAVEDESIRQYLATKQPLRGGPGAPEDCAEAAVFLCSDEARFLTGTVLTLDGGWTLSDGQYGGSSNQPLQ